MSPIERLRCFVVGCNNEVTWHTNKYGYPYSEFVLCFYPILSAHTQQWTHTKRKHTPGAVGSHLCCGARGAVGGSVPCSRAPQSWYWRWRECCTFTIQCIVHFLKEIITFILLSFKFNILNTFNLTKFIFQINVELYILQRILKTSIIIFFFFLNTKYSLNTLERFLKDHVMAAKNSDLPSQE